VELRAGLLHRAQQVKSPTHCTLIAVGAVKEKVCMLTQVSADGRRPIGQALWQGIGPLAAAEG
jgi:hypothetical protein